MTKQEIKEAIENISNTMKGPLPNVERFTLHEERKELRKQLAEMDQLEAKNPTLRKK